MGDFNEVIGLDTSGIAKILQTGRLTDTQIYCHGIDLEESTCARGPNRVDYIFVSECLLPHLHGQGCEPFNARIFSDHRGLFLDITYPGLFDGSPNIMPPPTRRNMRHDCPKHIAKYLHYMSKYMEDHNLLDRALLLQNPEPNHDAAKSLDRDITKGLLSAKADCKNFHRSPWSPPSTKQ
jgi:hypothetical protein